MIYYIYIEEAEFYANEVRHNGDQIKYTVLRDKNKSNKIILKKKIMNWINFDKK